MGISVVHAWELTLFRQDKCHFVFRSFVGEFRKILSEYFEEVKFTCILGPLLSNLNSVDVVGKG